MFKKLLNISSFLLNTIISIAQSSHSPIQAPNISSGAYSQHFQDAFSFTANPASLSPQAGICAGSFTEKRFMLDELKGCFLAAHLQMASTAFGMRFQYFGFPDYNESTLGLAYAKKLGKLLSLGIEFNYELLHISGYDSEQVFGLKVAGIFYPTEQLIIGWDIELPAGALSGKSDGERLASLYKMAVGYEATDEVYFAIEMIKEEDWHFNANAAIHYAFSKSFFAGLGMLSSTASPYGWAGWAWKELRIDITVSHHPQLGFTPGIKLLFGSASKKEDERNVR